MGLINHILWRILWPPLPEEIVWEGMPLQVLYNSTFLYISIKATITFLDTLYLYFMTRMIDETLEKTLEKMRESGTNTIEDEPQLPQEKPITRRTRYKFLFSVLLFEGGGYILPAARLALEDMGTRVFGVWDEERLVRVAGRRGEMAVLEVNLFEFFVMRRLAGRRMGVGWRLEMV